MEGDFRSIVNLLTDQIEFANVIVINKIDLVKPESVSVLKAAIHKLNPKAQILESSFSKIAPSAILKTGLYNVEEAESSSAWQEELSSPEHNPETEEYGISSFVYRSKLPFHSERFWLYIQHMFPSTVIRSKGLFWLGSRPQQALIWNQAGGSLRAESAGLWWTSMPYAERIRYDAFLANQKDIESKWHHRFGDRHNEIVFIGQDMNREEILEGLEACLMTEEEMATLNLERATPDSWPVPRVDGLSS